MYMNYHQKYLKYKNKYLELKQHIGGSDLQSCDMQELKNGIILGKGSNGIIILPKSNATTVYKMLINNNACSDASEESKIHKITYTTFLQMDITIRPYNFAYIPKPICYIDNPTNFEYQTNDTIYKIKCIYGMEYMKPVQFGEFNKFNDLYLPIHLAVEDEIGFKKDDELRGYYVSTIEHLDEVLQSLNSKYGDANVPNVFEIFNCMGYLFALAWFSAKYYPIDMQFMLSEQNGKVKVVCFDFGLYESISNYKVKLIDLDESKWNGIRESIPKEQLFSDNNLLYVYNFVVQRNRYLSLALDNGDIISNSFLDGMQVIVSQLNDAIIDDAFMKFKNFVLNTY